MADEVDLDAETTEAPRSALKQGLTVDGQQFVDQKLEDEIKTNYEMVYAKKVLPSMRSLQFGGKPIEISPNRLYNCSFLPIDHIDSLSEIMFLLLSGCGVGYSVQKHNIKQLPDIIKPHLKLSDYLNL